MLKLPAAKLDARKRRQIKYMAIVGFILVRVGEWLLVDMYFASQKNPPSLVMLILAFVTFVTIMDVLCVLRILRLDHLRGHDER